jgi:hypothetical protein
MLKHVFAYLYNFNLAQKEAGKWGEKGGPVLHTQIKIICLVARWLPGFEKKINSELLTIQIF